MTVFGQLTQDQRNVAGITREVIGADGMTLETASSHSLAEAICKASSLAGVKVDETGVLDYFLTLREDWEASSDRDAYPARVAIDDEVEFAEAHRLWEDEA
jgi:hypothetical protein